MKANEFVKNLGLGEASEIVQGVPSKYMECYYSNLCWCTNTYKYSDRFKPRDSLVNIAWLKRLVESYELVESCGGLESVGEKLTHGLYESRAVIERLNKAIADVESCL